MSASRSLLLLTAAGAVACLAFGVRAFSAGTNAAEEAAIRKAISAVEAGRGRLQQYAMPDMVYFTGAMKRPTVGGEPSQPIEGPEAPANRVPGSQTIHEEIIRIVVAESRDLAYEYSKGTLTYDLKTGEHRTGETGVLRVWQKQSGEWKVAAMFVHPYQQ